MSRVKFTIYRNGKRYVTRRTIHPDQEAREWLPGHVNIDQPNTVGWAFHVSDPRRFILPTDTLSSLAHEIGTIPSHVTVTKQRRIRFYVLRDHDAALQLHTLYGPDVTAPSVLLNTLADIPLVNRVYQSYNTRLSRLVSVHRTTPIWVLEEAKPDPAADLILLVRPTERIVIRVDNRRYRLNIDPLDRIGNMINVESIPYPQFHIVYRHHIVPRHMTLSEARTMYGPSKTLRVIPPLPRRGR